MSRHTFGSIAAAAVAASVLAACASTGGGSLSGRHITDEDLRGTSYHNAADVLDSSSLVEARGEGFVLSSRGRRNIPDSFGRDTAGGGMRAGDPARGSYAIVELDGTRLGTDARSVLSNIPVDAIQEIRLLRPAEALSHYGDAGNGLIIVETKR